MGGLKKLAHRPTQNVYFGHPLPFWEGRRRGDEQILSAQVQEHRHLEAVTNHGAAMQRRQLLNRVESRVRDELTAVEREMEAKRQRLREFLDREKEDYCIELAALEQMRECQVCEEKNTKSMRHEEELEREKVIECQHALEREKIAGGLKCGKHEEAELRRIQKLQMIEKEQIEKAEKERENMWHRVLMDDWKKKELEARSERERRESVMRETRRAYDEHVASARERRSQAMRAERERENSRLEAVRRRMEKDREEEIKRKKERQKSLELYFEEDRRCRMTQRLRNKEAEKALDDAHIRRCREEMQREVQKQEAIMRRLQTEKAVFLENYTGERRAAAALEMASEVAGEQCAAQAQRESDREWRKFEEIRMKKKEEEAKIYQRHLQATLDASAEARRNRTETGTRVRETAIEHIRRDLSEVEQQIERQYQYRQGLSAQIRSNRDALKHEKSLIEKQQEPFVKKANSFRDVMLAKVGWTRELNSILPVHPFKRVLAQLPTIQHTKDT